MRRIVATFALLAGLLAATSAQANIQIGDAAPNFTKSRLGGGTASLSDYAGKVVVLFLFGYSCPVCLNQCPDFESGIHQYYQSMYPGQVQVLGVDSWNGTIAQVTNFRDQTGASFPLLLNGASATGGNMDILYGPWDNYIVISKQGIVRYHAANVWPHGNRQHLNEIRGAVDTLVSAQVSVDPPPPSAAADDELRIAAAPNPFRDRVRVELTLSRAIPRARVELHDVTGRRVARLHDSGLPAGVSRFDWRVDRAAELAPGVYVLAVDLDGRRLQRRIVKLP